jgi:hypothetical protein
LIFLAQCFRAVICLARPSPIGRYKQTSFHMFQWSTSSASPAALQTREAPKGCRGLAGVFFVVSGILSAAKNPAQLSEKKIFCTKLRHQQHREL